MKSCWPCGSQNKGAAGSRLAFSDIDSYDIGRGRSQRCGALAAVFPVQVTFAPVPRWTSA